MKLITAVVQPGKLDEVMRAVTQAGAGGLTVTEVRGFGQQYGHGHLGVVRPAERQAMVLPKLRIDAVVPDEVAEAVIEAIAKAAHTGAIGDGKIWVSAVESALRVRTGERDHDAV